MRMWEERHTCDDGSDGPSLDVVLVMEKIAKVWSMLELERQREWICSSGRRRASVRLSGVLDG